MFRSIHRPSRIFIDESALIENIQQEKKRLASDCDLFAVVKANGYGHGAVEVAKIAKRAGASGFCVATIDEAIELRENGLTEKILLLSIVSPEYLPLLAQYDLSVTVATMEWLVQASEVTVEKPVSLHIKVDSGMGRIGFCSKEEVLSAVRFIQERTKMFRWEGIFTHFATADERDEAYFHQQASVFNEIIENLPEKPRYLHVANTATSFWHKACGGNMVRFGIGIYGLNPSGIAREEVYPLKPVLSLESELIQVKKMLPNSCIGYGATYTTQEEEWIGTVPVGYADGWLRKLQNFHVLIHGEECQIVGRICMDQFMVKLPRKFSVGDTVTLIGKNGGKEITMQMIADFLETIHYEVACTLSDRLPRIYKRRKKDGRG